MFLKPHQPSTTPTMAEIASRNFPSSNPISPSPFPVQEPLQINPTFSPNLPLFYNPGSSSIYSNQNGGLNCNFNGSLKRLREEQDDGSEFLNRSINGRICSDLKIPMEGLMDQNRACSSSSCSSFNPELYFKIETQQQELDRFLILQTEKLKAELDQKKRDYWRHVLASMEQGMHRIIKGKDEQIARLSSKNSALKERIRALLLEGQFWKSLAQASEATVTGLRRDLQLAQVKGGEEEGQGDNNGRAEDSQSRCDGDVIDERYCRGCRKRERSVLVLPCRHLCLCKECDKRFESCPLCKCAKRASVQVYMS